MMRKITLLMWCAVVALVVGSVGCDMDAQNHGKNLYNTHCESCHGAKGEGLGRLIPPLNNADFLKNHQDILPCVIKRGIHGEVTVNGVTYDGSMEGISTLSSVEIFNLISYVNEVFLDEEIEVNINDVEQALNECPKTGVEM